MLGRSHGYSSGSWSTHNSYHADGGGNVTYLVNSSQTLAASYRYDPFGNTISSSGTLASANVYRFSSKEIHVNSGMYCYGFRWYSPNLQRWLNRDPITDDGGLIHNTAKSAQSESPLGIAATVQRFRKPLELFTKINANVTEFVANDPLGSYDAQGLYSGCDYLCIRISTLLNYFVCAFQSQYPTDCPSCPTIAIVQAHTGRYRLFFMTTLPCPVCGEGQKPQPSA